MAKVLFACDKWKLTRKEGGRGGEEGGWDGEEVWQLCVQYNCITDCQIPVFDSPSLVPTHPAYVPQDCQIIMETSGNHGNIECMHYMCARSTHLICHTSICPDLTNLLPLSCDPYPSSPDPLLITRPITCYAPLPQTYCMSCTSSPDLLYVILCALPQTYFMLCVIYHFPKPTVCYVPLPQTYCMLCISSPDLLYVMYLFPRPTVCYVPLPQTYCMLCTSSPDLLYVMHLFPRPTLLSATFPTKLLPSLLPSLFPRPSLGGLDQGYHDCGIRVRV